MVQANEMAPGLHKCPKPSCEIQLPTFHFACRTHWFQIPRDLRERLQETWRHGTIADYLEARTLAVHALEVEL